LYFRSFGIQLGVRYYHTFADFSALYFLREESLQSNFESKLIYIESCENTTTNRQRRFTEYFADKQEISTGKYANVVKG
jgi:hypothetical protein